VIVAGEPEFATRAERLRTGIPLNDAFLDEVRAVATNAGVDFILDSTVQ
jgi:LDH2 family malate/lactate/ureidoglycolate dehydrogenase